MSETLPARSAHPQAPASMPKKHQQLARVRDYFAAHLCATHGDCAKALGISSRTVGFYAAILRDEWRDK